MTALLVFLAILDLEAFAAFLWIILTPSEPGEGIFVWLSRERLVLAAVILCLLAALLVTTVRLWRDRGAAEAFLKRLDGWLLDQHQLVPVRVVLVLFTTAITVATAAVILTPPEYDAYQSLAPDTFPLLLSLTYALVPVLALITLACLQTATFLRIRYPGALRSRAAWDWAHVGPALVLFLAVLITAFHWLTLLFQLRFFVNIPAWYWIFEPVPFGVGDVWFVLGALALVVLTYWALIGKQRIVIGLVCLLALGWFLQMGVGLMGGRGVETLRDRYFTTYHQTYVARAADNDHSILVNVREYDALHGSNSFTVTKPPGLMAVYIGFEQLVNGYPSSHDSAARYARLSTAVVWTFPLLAAGTAALLWVFARRLTEDSPSLVPPASALLYVLTPSLALFTFFADQAVYPAVFLVGTWFTVSVIRTGSPLWAALLGAAFYLAAFFSFTLLALYVFAGLYLLLHAWQEHTTGRLRHILLTGLGIAAGTLIAYVVGRALFNYDFVPSFSRSMFINHNFDFYTRVGEQPTGVAEPLGVRIAQIANAAWVNNLDFAAAIGFPIYILFITQAVRRIWRFTKGAARSASDAIMLALLGSFLLLNLVGSAQGEVPRLWLFWVPMVVLLAAFELQPYVERRPQVLLGLSLVQLITLVLTFHFQDLRM